MARLINIGFGNVVNSQKIVAVVSPDAAPVKRMVQSVRGTRPLIDATQGRKTKAVIVTSDDYLVLSALQPETIARRFAEIYEYEDKGEEIIMKKRSFTLLMSALTISVTLIGTSPVAAKTDTDNTKSEDTIEENKEYTYYLNNAIEKEKDLITSKEIKYTYDEGGNISSIINNNKTENFIYDEKNRLIKAGQKIIKYKSKKVKKKRIRFIENL